MANLRATTVACIVLVMATGLLGEQEKSRRRERHDDPNASRASRLLYSPRSRTAGSVKSADMHTVLRRFRASQPHALNDRQVGAMSNAIADHSHEQAADWKTSPGVASHRTEEEERQLKELCHAKILQKCGAAVIEGFAEPNLPLDEKCRIRENFLHCVIKMKRRTCRQKSPQDFLLTEDFIRSLRQQILTLLWSARGCVLGMEAP